MHCLYENNTDTIPIFRVIKTSNINIDNYSLDGFEHSSGCPCRRDIIISNCEKLIQIKAYMKNLLARYSRSSNYLS